MALLVFVYVALRSGLETALGLSLLFLISSGPVNILSIEVIFFLSESLYFHLDLTSLQAPSLLE